MTAIRSLLSIILILGVLHTTISVNYCDKSLCRDGEKHVACNNNGKLAKQCSSDAKVIEMKQPLRDLIVKNHNELRNKFAQGFDKFSPAARMGTMKWSDELAKLAELNVKKCDGEHDECNNTPKFPHAGQNIAQDEILNESVEVIVNSNIQDWFGEYTATSVANMKSFPNDSTISNYIGHFTAVVQEKSVDVGCAILRQTNSDRMMEQTMTCNYGYSNMINKPVYTQGKAASECKTGTNPNYKYLCSIKEVY